MDRVEAFWAKVEIGEGCWNWTGALDRYGYGQFTWEGKNWRAHRVAWVLCGEELPPKLKLDHECENRRCVRPYSPHNRPLSQRENVLRSKTNPVAINARKTQCVHGHEYTPENTGYSDSPGHEGRFCKRCRSAGKKRRVESPAIRPVEVVAAAPKRAVARAPVAALDYDKPHKMGAHWPLCNNCR